MQINTLIKILAFSFLLLSVNIPSVVGLEPPLKVAWKSRLGIASTDIGPQSIRFIVNKIHDLDTSAYFLYFSNFRLGQL